MLEQMKMWVFTHRKPHYSWKEHAEWNFAPYMDILPGVFSQRK